MTSPSIVWFRDDLRLADNPALRAAVERDEPIIALFVLDEESPGIRPLGGAARTVSPSLGSTTTSAAPQPVMASSS